MTLKSTLSCLVLVASAAVYGPAQAQTMLLDFTSSSSSITGTDDSANQTNNDAIVVGYDFILTEAKTVTGLGVWDFSGNGLHEDHTVWLWDSNGDIVASVTVGSGTGQDKVVDSADTGPFGAPSKGGESVWRFESLMNSINLAIGTYYLGAYFHVPDGDPTPSDYDSFLLNAASVTPASGVTYGTGRYADVGEGFSGPNPFPSGSSNTQANARFGPNLLLQDVATVPEPGTMALAALGLMGMGLARRRKAD